jgi:hypothetical protein
MSTKGRKILLAAGVLGLGSILGTATPALAQSHGGGGGGHAGGGAHGFSGGHAAGGHVGGGAHFAGTAHFAAGHAYGGGYAGGHGYQVGHAGYSPGGFSGHGYSTGAYWRGGYWHGGFWPRAYYGAGFSWFLPILPLAYATYWYSGIPYYYANDVYYTYDQGYQGYVATDPPPASDSGDSSGSAAAVPNNSGAPDPAQGIAGQVFMYPKNGQSSEQQATDKAECQQWAAQQAGQVAQNGSDYQRAMTACVEGRGYSAR